MTLSKKTLLVLIAPAVLSLSLSAPAIALSRSPAVDTVASGCTPAPHARLCSGSITLKYLGKTTTFAPVECAIPSSNSISFEVFYNYNFNTDNSQVPGKFFIGWASLDQGGTTATMMGMRWDLSLNQKKKINLLDATLTIKADDSSGKITATDGGKAILATFTCK
jgi:hypothetical protein